MNRARARPAVSVPPRPTSADTFGASRPQPDIRPPMGNDRFAPCKGRDAARRVPLARFHRRPPRHAAAPLREQADQSGKSVDRDRSFHVSVSAVTYAFLSAIAFSVSVPSGRRRGGVCASASVTRAVASFSGSPGLIVTYPDSQASHRARRLDIIVDDFLADDERRRIEEIGAEIARFDNGGMNAERLELCLNSFGDALDSELRRAVNAEFRRRTITANRR